MCGIAGFLNFNSSPAERELLQRMTDSLLHRGPDGAGHFVAGPVALGHRRLSIIDLEAGKQPLSNEDDTIWITFNGEIYNYRELRQRLEGYGHRFRTHSDTEVLVHAYEQWGTECLQLLRGMFAFAIWDSRLQQLFLARDRLGIKPLLYSITDKRLAFGSELQALRTLPDFSSEIDLEAVDQFLHYQYIPAPKTIYRVVIKLQPAHYIVYDRHGRSAGPQRYWKLRFTPDRTLNAAAWQERLQDALTETVRTHLVADVPFGAFLSGGIDSSLVVAAMSQILPQPIQAFCIGHPNPDFDERRWARQAATECGAEFIDEVIDEDSLSLIPDLVRHYGEPFADSSALPTYYVSRLAARSVKMVLSGDGGDELGAGYHAYPAILWEHRPPGTPWQRIRHRLGDLARLCHLRPQVNSPADSKYRRTSPIDPTRRQQLWNKELQGLVNRTRNQFDSAYRTASQQNLLDTLQAFDLENYIPYDNLVKVDIASMFHGLEVRVPLLDHQFVETMAQVPPELRLSGLDHTGRMSLSPQQVQGKLLLKQLAEKRFGREFVHRPKQGFEVPVQRWFAGASGYDLKARILDPDLPMADWFNRTELERMTNAAGDSKLGAWQAWSLLVLAEWCRQEKRPLHKTSVSSWA